MILLLGNFEHNISLLFDYMYHNVKCDYKLCYTLEKVIRNNWLLIGNFEHWQYCEFINWLNVMWAACKCDYGYCYDLGHVITDNVISC